MSQLFSEFRLCLTISEMVLYIGHKTVMFKHIITTDLSFVYILNYHIPNKLFHSFVILRFPFAGINFTHFSSPVVSNTSNRPNGMS